jgi:hypothetical protein
MRDPGRKQVPKRAYSLEELRLNNIEAERLLSPRDNTLSSVRTRLQVRAPHLDAMAAGSSGASATRLNTVCACASMLRPVHGRVRR